MAQAIALQDNSTLTTIRPSTIPAAGTKRAPILYLPELHDRTGNYTPEQKFADLHLPAIVSGITGGEFPNLLRVIGIDIATGRAWDASEEIGMQVFEQAIDFFGFVPATIRDFLEEALGVNTLRSMELEAAA